MIIGDMMQWNENSANRYGASPPISGTVNNGERSSHSTPNSTGSLYNNNNTSTVTSSQSNTNSTQQNATQQLQNSLSMLPQSCSVYGVHPVDWGREEVKQWLKWCIGEFSFTDVQVEKFAMNGKALILLKKEDFIERSPSAGDVLYNILQKLLDAQSKSSALAPAFSGADIAGQAALMNLMMMQNPFFAHGLMSSGAFPTFPGGLGRSSLPLTPPSTSSPQLGDSDRSSPSSALTPNQSQRSSAVARSISHSPQDAKLAAHFRTDPSYHTHSRKSEGELHLPTPLLSRGVSESVIKATPTHHHPFPHLYRSPKEEPMDIPVSPGRGKSDCRLLWEFISKLLKDSNYTDYIKWENASDYTFRIVNPAQLSKLWGIQKNRTNMTYEKLSRALRYYYRMDIIEKVPGRRLTYRFMRPPHEIKRGQRGAKPGVPRKSRSTDEETECIDEVDPVEGGEMSDMSGEEDRLNSDDYVPEYKPRVSLQPERAADSPIDLVNHQRHSSAAHSVAGLGAGGVVYPGGTYSAPVKADLTPKSEPLLQSTNTSLSQSLAASIKPDLNGWAPSNSMVNNHQLSSIME